MARLMEPRSVRVRVVLSGGVKAFVEDHAERFNSGVVAASIREIVDYNFKRMEKLGETYFTDLFFNLDEYHNNRAVSQNVVMDKMPVYLSLPREQVEYMDNFLNKMSYYIGRNGNRYPCRALPQFNGMRRNFIYQCVYNYMYDMAKSTFKEEDEV